MRQHAVDRRAGRRHHRVRQAPAPRVPAARGLHGRHRLPAPPHLEGRRAPLGRPLPPEAAERLAYELQVISDMGFSSYFLIVWDLIKHAKDNGIRVGPGRGSAAGCAVAYCLRHHRPRPDPLRPAVRAVPQPEPDLHAGHRHGLRLPLPGRDDPLRRPEVRAGPRRPDHHLLDDQGPGRGAGRGRGARPSVRGRRPRRQGHAAAGHGPGHAAEALPRGASPLRGRVQGGGRPPFRCTAPIPTSSRWSTWRWGWRACVARTASTPPRWSSPRSR